MGAAHFILVEELAYNVCVNVVGQTFGLLIVLSESIPEGAKHSYVLCRCECGKEIQKRKSAVIAGHTKSCGCKSEEFRRLTLEKAGKKVKGNPNPIKAIEKTRLIAEARAKELIGKTFHYLTVIEVNSPKVTCRCVCGTIKIANRSDVVAGKTTSCGCKRAERQRLHRPDWPEYLGARFGMIEITQLLEKHRCLGLCDCGRVKEYFIGNLTSGQIKSCGCSTFEIRVNTNLEKYGAEMIAVNVSRGERELRSWVESLGLETTRKVVKANDGREFELDIVVESEKLAIEFNGERFHSDQFRPPLYHKDKSDAAAANGYRLIHVFENEWKKREVAVKSFLRSALKKNERKIPARKVRVALVPKEDARLFLETYHLLGFVAGTYVGCYFEDELVALGVFRKHYMRDVGLTLARWCGKDSVTVQGALSKVMKNAFAVAAIPPQEVTTWVDLRLAGAEGYLRSGWALDAAEPPDYFYFDPRSRKVIYRYRRRKTVMNTPKHTTETEHADLDGLYRIWDCGMARLRYKPA